MITIDDIAGVLVSVLNANAAFLAAVPGRAWFERAPDTPAAYPYAVFHIHPAKAELNFDDFYFQAFTITLAAYVPQGAEASPGDPAGVQQALFSSLATESASALFQASALRNSTECILHAIPLAATGVYARQLRDGRDVFACELSLQVLVQGDRSVA